MKNLLYPAAGRIRPAYRELPFDLICLVDYRYEEKIKRIGKILALGMEAIDAILYLREKKLKFDYLVILNEGLYEGGGIYPFHSDLFLGFVMPLLNDTYIHIMEPEYYSYFRKKLNLSLDLPYEKVELTPEDKEYLNPAVFGYPTAKVYLMKKVSRKKEIVFANGKRIHIVHDSVWNYYDELDLIVTFFKGNTKDRIVSKLPKVRNFELFSPYFLEHIIDECQTYGYSKIGFTAFATRRREYLQFFSFVERLNLKCPGDFYIFHLNRGDYIEEYQTL